MSKCAISALVPAAVAGLRFAAEYAVSIAGVGSGANVGTVVRTVGAPSRAPWVELAVTFGPGPDSPAYGYWRYGSREPFETPVVGAAGWCLGGGCEGFGGFNRISKGL